MSELTLTPALMYSTRLVTLWDMVVLRMNPALRRRAPLLEGLSAWEARKVVLLGRLEAVPAGTVVVRKGDPGTEMYMIVSERLRHTTRVMLGEDRAPASLAGRRDRLDPP